MTFFPFLGANGTLFYVNDHRVFHPYGHELLIYLRPRAWNSFQKLGSTHICATGSALKKWLISCFPLFCIQISSLVTLQLLAQVSHDDQLDAPKYKCAVSMDFICAISRCGCNMSQTDAELCKRSDLLQVFYMFYVFYLSGRWILRLWSTFMTSCEAAEEKGEATKGGFIHLYT